MKFVVAVDGSSPSKIAFEYILDLAVKKVDEVVIASSIATKKGFLSKSVEGEEARVAALHTDYEAVAAAKWVSAFGAVLRGDARRTLSQYTLEVGADVLVVGARGLGALQRALVGSVSSYIVSHCHHAVMVVKKHLPVSPRKFLLCYDGSEPSRAAIPLMLRLARPGNSVFIVHVVEDLHAYKRIVADADASSCPSSVDDSIPEESPEEQANIKLQMDAIAESFRKGQLNALVMMEHGDPREIVSRLMQRLNIDMAVAGSSGRGGLHWWSTGSFSADLVQSATCNAVLVVKPQRENPECAD